MQFMRGGLSSCGGGGGGGAVGGMMWEVVRHFSRKRAVDVRRISPKVPKEEAVAISGRLLQILNDHGPLTVSNTWNHAKDAGINSLNSKTHMKIMLKWMTGRRLVKLSCVHVGSAKKFMYAPFSENSQPSKEPGSSSPSPEPMKVSLQGGKGTRGQPKKPTAA